MRKLAFASLLLAAAGSAGPAAAQRVPAPERHALIAPTLGEVRETTDSLMTWSERNGVVHPGTRYVRTVRHTLARGRPRWRAESVWFDSAGRVMSRTVSEADAATLAPIASTVRADRDSASLAVVDGRVVGWAVLPMGQPRFIDEALPGGVIAPELEDAAVAALPLAVGYRTQLAVLGALGGVQRHALEVAGRDTVTAAGAVRACWKVTLGSGGEHDARLTLWVDRSSRRVWQRRGDYPAFSWVHRVTNP